MNIGSITPLMQIRNNFASFNKTSFKGTEYVDTFERTTSSIVQGENRAIKWLKETDFVNKSLAETLANSENILGEGFSHVVYQIPGNDEYILRMNKSSVKCDEIKNPEIKDVEDKNLPINIGQPVAQILFDTSDSYMKGYVEVLKKQNGESVGVKPPSAIYIEDTGVLRENEVPYEDASRKDKYERTIHKVAQLPVSAYEKFLEELTIAGEAGYKFDYYNSNNVLVDEDGQAINIIDMDQQKSPVDYGSVLFALTNIEYFNTFNSQYDASPVSDERKEQAFLDTVEIIDKYVQAMKNQGLKFDRENTSMYFYKLLDSFPCKFYCKSFDYSGQWAKFEQMGVA